MLFIVAVGSALLGMVLCAFLAGAIVSRHARMYAQTPLPPPRVPRVVLVGDIKEYAPRGDDYAGEWEWIQAVAAVPAYLRVHNAPTTLQ